MDGSVYFKCPECSWYKSSWDFALRHHLRFEHRSFRTTFYDCSADLEPPFSSNSRIRHSFVRTTESVVKDNLQRQYSDPSIIGVKRHDNGLWFECLLCFYESENEADVAKHIQDVHDETAVADSGPSVKEEAESNEDVEDTAAEIEIKCAYCDHKTSLQDDLKKHVKSKHPPLDGLYCCNYCSYKTKRRNHLKCHMLVHKTADEIEWFKCPQCSYKFKRKDHLAKHLQSKVVHKNLTPQNSSHVPSGSLVVEGNVGDQADSVKWCQFLLCSYKIENSADVAKQNVHNRLAVEVCDPSVIKEEVKKDGAQVGNSATADNEINCLYCKYKTSWECDMKEHVQSKHSLVNGKYRCDYCPSTFQVRLSLRRHYTQEHKPADKIEWFKCHLCLYKTKRRSDLLKHLRAGTVHENLSPITSGHFVSGDLGLFSGFSNSSKIIEGNVEAVDGDKWCECLLCSYKSENAAELTKHVQDIHNRLAVDDSDPVAIKDEVESDDDVEDTTADDEFKCGYCEYKTSSLEGVKEHVQAKHVPADRTHCCKYCSYHGETRVQLRDHMVVHVPADEVQWFKCPDCPYMTNRKGSLKTHLRKENVHKQPLPSAPVEKLSRCSQCSFTTQHAGNLGRHVRRKHTPKKETSWHQCDECPYECRRKGELLLHANWFHPRPEGVEG